MMSTLRLMSLLALVLALAWGSSAISAEELVGGERMQRSDMQDAVKYLDELDRYYAQIARPRERRVGQSMASAMEKLAQIKNYYNEAGRPRFGKRFVPRYADIMARLGPGGPAGL